MEDEARNGRPVEMRVHALIHQDRRLTEGTNGSREIVRQILTQNFLM